MIMKLKNYLKQIRGGIDNLQYIRLNQERDLQVRNYQALLADDSVRLYLQEVRDLMTVKDLVGGDIM